MIIKFSKNFESKFKKIQKKDNSVKKRLDRKLQLLIENPRHPSLRLHKIEGKYEAWSISVDMSLRILFIYRKYGILLVNIGGHDEVY